MAISLCCKSGNCVVDGGVRSLPDLLSPCDPIIDVWDIRRRCVSWAERGLVSKLEVKRHSAGSGVMHEVLLTLCPNQELRPVMLPTAAVSLRTLLSLTVELQVVTRGQAVEPQSDRTSSGMP